MRETGAARPDEDPRAESHELPTEAGHPDGLSPVLVREGLRLGQPWQMRGPTCLWALRSCRVDRRGARNYGRVGLVSARASWSFSCCHPSPNDGSWAMQ